MAGPVLCVAKIAITPTLGEPNERKKERKKESRWPAEWRGLQSKWDLTNLP